MARCAACTAYGFACISEVVDLRVFANGRGLSECDGSDPYVRLASKRIVILTAFEALAHSAEVFDERTPIDAEMGGVHTREERVRAPIRFEVGIDEFAGRVVQLIFVGVDEIRVGSHVEQECNFEERIRRQDVVVIQ